MREVSDCYRPSFSSLNFWRIHTLTSLFGTVWTPFQPPPPFLGGKETISCGKEIERGVDRGIGLGEGESKGDGKVRKGCVERYGEE